MQIFRILNIILLLFGFTFAQSVQKDTAAQQHPKEKVPEPHNNPEIVFPGNEWQVSDPQEFGIASENLNKIKQYFEDIDGDALVILFSGHLIASWGDVDENIQCRSIRKSFLSACFGRYQEKFKLDATLKDMNISDKGGLSKIEQTATLKNLMTTSSDIFHPAAYEPYGAEDRKPARGTYKAGEKFYYNNWDFNVLGTIFNRQTGKDLFEVFNNEIAKPINMQDFSLDDTEYYEDDNSVHPAYLFDMSARDCARFGLLYLANGRWKNQQIIPQDWVKESTDLHVDFKNTNGYGYLWWVTSDDFNYDKWAFFARGNSGQYIYVNPYRSVVIVFRADPGTILNLWLGMRVKWSESVRFIPMINKLISLRSH